MSQDLVSQSSVSNPGHPLRVVLVYRALFHWRPPVFRRLATESEIDSVALYGADFPGTKAVSGSDLSGFRSERLAALRLPVPEPKGLVQMPLFPNLPLRLAGLRPDVILTEGGSNLANDILVFLYAWISRTPVVRWTLGELPATRPLSRSQRIFRCFVRSMEQRSAALLGYSSLAIRYFDRQGYPKEKQFKAVNCVDTDLVFEEIRRLRDDADSLRTELDLDGKFVLLYVGAMAASKQLEDLIDVYARLRLRYESLRLVMVGEGVHRASLQEHAQRVGAGEVLFAGQIVDKVSAYFLLGSVFVLAGLGGLAISQAMAHGLPVIATQADGCELDLVRDGENGFLVPVGEVAELEERIESLIREPERTAAMGERSRTVIENELNIHTYMENVVDAIRYAAGIRS